MRILRLIYDWPPPWGGLAPHPYELTLSQVKKGHKFDIFCGRWPKAGPIEEPRGTKVYPVMRAPFYGTMLLTSAMVMFWKYLFWRDEEKNNVDLIHSHGHFGFWVYLYRVILEKIWPKSRELQTPLVVHFHNTVAGRWEAAKEKDTEIKPISKYLDWPLAKLSDKLAVKAADACIFVSQDNLQEAIKYYSADPSKCYVVETGVNTQMFTSVGQEEFEKTRKDLGLDPFDTVVLNHGSMVERKNIHLLVEAVRYLPDNFKLLLVGPGDPSYLGRIKEIIDKYHLHNRVIQAGYTPYPHAPISFQAANIFVLPSSFEGFPKVVTQSLSCGVPALVSGFKAQDKISGLYYLDDLEPQTIARQIQEVLHKEEPVDTAYIREYFSWDTRASQIEAIYQKLQK
jgi:glycosyltransferase involved in cell wall biosynthesis